jgi:hypothetical protein
VSAESLIRTLAEEEGYRAVHIWPLVYEDRVEAAVACYYNTAHAPSDTDQEVMLAFARQAAVALQNARLYEEAQRRAAHLEALNAIIHSAASASDLQHLLENALDHTLKAIGLGAGVIWLDDRVVLRDIPVEFLSDRKSVFSGGGIGPRATIAVPDWRQVDAGKPYAGYAKVMKKNGLRATLTTPILWKAGGSAGWQWHQPSRAPGWRKNLRSLKVWEASWVGQLSGSGCWRRFRSMPGKYSRS